MPPFPPEVDTFRFFAFYGFLNGLQSTSAVQSDAGSLLRSFGRDIKSKLKVMSLEVDSGRHTEYIHQYIYITVPQAVGSISLKNK